MISRVDVTSSRSSDLYKWQPVSFDPLYPGGKTWPYITHDILHTLYTCIKYVIDIVFTHTVLKHGIDVYIMVFV